jgi:hypothetical protein
MQGPHTGDSAAHTGGPPGTPDWLLLVPFSKQLPKKLYDLWQLMHP